MFFEGVNPLAFAENSQLLFEYEAWYILSAKLALVMIYLFFME